MSANQNPEQAARDRVDRLLTDSGWAVQDKKAIDFNAGPGVAMTEKWPSSWAVCQFADLLRVQGGSQPPKSEFIFEPRDGYIQLLQIRDFGEKPVPTFVRKDSVSKFCEKHDIMIARYGASLGRIAYKQSACRIRSV